MPKFKVIVSDPETGKSKSLEMEETRSPLLIGRKLGEVIDGSAVGMSGYKLQITGGSDKDGFPMRLDVHGGVRVNVIVGEGIGFRPSRKGGERRRKALRGNVITEEIVQVNMKIVQEPKKEGKEAKRKKGVSERVKETT